MFVPAMGPSCRCRCSFVLRIRLNYLQMNIATVYTNLFAWP